MTRRIRWWLFLALPLSFGACSVFFQKRAQETSFYLRPAQIERADFPAAPLPDSSLDKADFATLHQWQDKRTEAECGRARAEADATFDEFFASDSPFRKPLPPQAASILARVRSDVDAADATIKRRYKRPRPFRRDSTLSPCLGRIGGYAYPSGHAAISRVFARILAELVPGRKAEFLARADEAALDRIIGGVHHPSDIEAGKRLGDELYEELRESPSFRGDLETLRGFLAFR
jgi:acid phosphatase (class A)